MTSNAVHIANITTLTDGLFKGALVGAQAYAAYVNSQGGVNGRKLVVDSYDDNFAGATNLQETQAALQSDFATVGNFTLEDSFGEKILAENPGFPNVSQNLSLAATELPNSFSPSVVLNGYPLGPLAYFKQKYPQAIKHVGTLVSALPEGVAAWNSEKAAMLHLGYNVQYDSQYATSQFDFTPNVIAMRNAGVQIVFLENLTESYASSFIKDLNEQNFHPILVLGSSSYSEALVSASGGPSAIDGTFMWQSSALYLGEDSGSIPAVSTFLSWVKKTDPGFTPDYYTLAGWTSADLFTQALRNAGKNPSRGSELAALKKITSYNAGYMLGTSNPADKQPTHCYVVSKIENGQYQRIDDPPTSGPSHGYRCDLSYYIAP